MDRFPNLPTSTNELLQQAEKNLHDLSKLILEGRKPPAGAYGFFHYNGHTLSRLADCGRVFDRLYLQISQLKAANIEEHRVMPREWPSNTPYPPEVNAAMRRSAELTSYMQLDMETLYMFGVTLLDQWALQALAIGNVLNDPKHPFVELVNYLEQNPSSVLSSLWSKLRGQILWLHYQLRFYRNRFIVHPTRPWQRGTTQSIHGDDDFQLFIPTPPGWLDDKELDGQILELLPLAPDHIRDAPADYWERARPGRLIEVLFDQIADFDPNDRQRIAELFGKKGGSTPSFQIIGNRLFEFIDQGTAELIELARNNLATIDLGAPQKTSQQMWQERD